MSTTITITPAPSTTSASDISPISPSTPQHITSSVPIPNTIPTPRHVVVPTVSEHLEMRRRQIKNRQMSTVATRRQNAVCVRRAHKHYGTTKNPYVILDGLNMTVPKGTIYGLLGASGCGKTTLLNCIVGRKRLNSGEIWVLGGRPGSRGSGVPGPRIGYMPQEIALYGEFTIGETMKYFGWISQMSSQKVEQRLQFLLEFLIMPGPERQVKTLSGGQQRRVSLAAALLHEPELLILDEPTVGVDPLLRNNIWEHLVQITKGGNTTVIITTHYIEETRQAHLIGLMRGGYFLAEESPTRLVQQFHAESLEDVFLKLSVIQNMGKRRKSSIATEVTTAITVPSGAINEGAVLGDEHPGEISGEFGDNISMSSRAGRISIAPDDNVPPIDLPPEEDHPRKCSDYFKVFNGSHMKALIWKNFLWMWRNYPVMLFIIGLPVFQSVVAHVLPLGGICSALAHYATSFVSAARRQEPYYGIKIGPLQNFAHGINGTVFAVDDSTIFIKGFSYDGRGPDAFFWIGNSPRPSPDGYIIPYPEDYTGRDPPILGAYQNADIILRLPVGKRIKDIRWLSVWCRRFTVDFGEVFIPPNLEVPKPRVLPEFKRLAHGLRSDNISILDAKTFYIPNLHYDGAGPDAYFWVGNGTEPNSFGIKVPNEMGSLDPLRGYQGEDIEIQLPGAITVYDIDWLAVWCVQYKHNFGHVFIPKDVDVPPALGQTKISTSSTSKPPISTNCREFLDKRLQVTWILKGDMVEITLSAKIREDQYVAFGLSGAQNRPQMVGADVTVAFYDSDLRTFRAVDYYLSHTAQCDGKVGVCPDEKIGGRDDVTLIKGTRNNGVLLVTYSRPLQTNEAVNDRAIPTGGPVSVIAAFGPLNSRKEANAHSVMDKTTEDYQIDFGDDQDHDCSGSLYDLVEDEGPKAWPQAKIIGENIFTARIGPTGGKRGYTKLTGLPSWGIAWWLNDLLIPELIVERGQTYSFVVEGGDDSTNPARYHPFYITDSREGGYGQKGAREQSKQKVYAGVEFDREGYPSPTASGRYCEWTHKSIDKSAESETFELYTKTLRLECEDGQPAYLNWTVPMDAPDQLYYQCYTHSNLGWKIKVVDPGYIEKQNGASEATMQSHLNLLIIFIGVTSSIFWLRNDDNVRIF